MALLLLPACRQMIRKITAAWLILLAAAPLMTTMVTSDRTGLSNRPTPVATRRAPSAPLTSSTSDYATAITALTATGQTRVPGYVKHRRSLSAAARPSLIAGSVLPTLDPGGTRSPILRL